MKTERGFIIWTAMLLYGLSVIKGQTSNVPPDVSSITALNEVIPTDHVTLKSVYLESQSLAYQNSSLSPSPKPEITPTASPPSRANSETAVHGNISASQTPELEDVTTLMMEAASAPASSASSSSLSQVESTFSESLVTTAPATSINSSEGRQMFSLTSSVVQKTQTAVPVTTSYPASQFALTGSSKVTGPAPLEDEPSELDVGDEDSGKVPHRPASPLDPLLAALVSIFIICTAMVSAILFLRFRQRNEHPEFHRLQDLPMDDLLEDTPLSRYSY
ncbi:uncharacterized protein si:ch73-344o19.1 [Triplophysa dalaica]|uniref:uncharacterized protein si:ch73-344o19.1 n=1 Tax=Triplophysa dalaica TaxID=1582913 RepID=UPI0024DF939D|nr:uncharacterized protein si:ch73-344o19.1 [Triplophysa dalaica]